MNFSEGGDRVGSCRGVHALFYLGGGGHVINFSSGGGGGATIA